MVEGYPAKISRGWDQTIEFNAKALSNDPDDPEFKVCYITCTKVGIHNITFNCYRISILHGTAESLSQM